MKHWFAHISFMVLGLAFGAQSDDKPLVYWVANHFPPAYMTEGADKGQGYADKITRYMADRLTNYTHVIASTNLARVQAEMKKRDGVCSASLYHTPEREVFIAFSRDIYRVLANRVIILKEKAEKLAPYRNERGEIDIGGLMAADHLSLGVVPGRYYNAAINGVLETIERGDNLVDIPYDRYGLLLLHGRIDYTFGYVPEASYQFRQQGQQDAFISFPIAGVGRTQKGGFSCSRKPLGQKVIAEIDALLETEDLGAVFEGFYEEWLDAGSLDEYRALRTSSTR